jgi:hypothetical protein
MDRREWLLRAGALLAAAASGATARADEVPYVQTPQNVVDAMLDIAGVRGSDFLIDLGSGDGRIVITAAKKFGTRGVGIDYDPYLVERSTRLAREAGVAERVTFVKKDIFDTDLAPASVITMYLLPEVNLALRPRLLATLKPGTRIVSHDWDMGDWRPDRSLTVDAPDKPVGREKLSRLHLWVVPAHAGGAWCGTGLNHGTRLRLTQKYQAFDATLAVGNSARHLAGRIEGARLRSVGGFEAAIDGARLRVTDRGDAPPELQGAEFARCAG